MIPPALPDFPAWYSSSHFGVVTCRRMSTSAGNRTDAPVQLNPGRRYKEMWLIGRYAQNSASSESRRMPSPSKSPPGGWRQPEGQGETEGDSGPYAQMDGPDGFRGADGQRARWQ